MRAGKLDKTILLQRSVTTLDEFGVPSETWSTLATLRAERIENATSETVTDAGARTEEVITFRTRFVEGVTVADRMSYAGSAFNIAGVTETGRRRGLQIICKRLGP